MRRERTHHIMSLKAELETWAAALKAYDEEDFEKSLDLFSVRFLICHLGGFDAYQ